MKSCKKCNNYYPSRIKIDGKVRNLKNRSYCLDCSPFNKHNTKQLDVYIKNDVCKECNNSLTLGRCHACYNRKRRQKMSKKVYDIIGYNCWMCGYTKGEISSKILTFHHINPQDKKMNLTIDNMARYEWCVVWNEIKKCVSLCPTCHQEYHYTNLVTDEDIERIKNENWNRIHDEIKL